MATTKTNLGLVEYAKAQLGLPYWYGTYGQTATKELYEYKKGKYPNQYKASDFPSQYGKKVHDCVGLAVKGYLMSETPTGKPKYIKEYDVSANGARKHCTVQGDIAAIPELPGVLVFMDGHVGVYIGAGEVIEARGHKYGVVQTKLAERPWKWWGKLEWIDYVEPVKKVDISVTVLKRGMKGLDEIKTLQILLNAYGFVGADGKPLAVDGSSGKNTEVAVKAFQQSRGLTVDGVVGKKTWAALIG